MSDYFALRDYFYENYRQEFGEGDLAMDMSEDAARAVHQENLTMEEQQRDLADLDNQIRFEGFAPSSNDSSPVQVAAATGGMLVGGKVVLVGLAVGVLALVGIGIYSVYKDSRWK